MPLNIWIAGERMGDKRDAWEIAIIDYTDYLAMEKSRSAATLDNYARDLRDFSAFLRQRGVGEPGLVNERLISAYLAGLSQAGRAASTIARRLSAIRGWCKYLNMMEERAISIANLQTPRLKSPFPSVLTLAQTEKLLDLPDTRTPGGSRDRAMLEFLYGCGLRVSELCGLTLHDINREQGFVRCWGKGGKERIVPAGSFALEAMEAYLAFSRPLLLAGQNTQALFVNQRGGPLSRSGLWRIVEGYGKRLGLDIHPHTLRHSAATHMLDNGADLRLLQEFLGHESISSTQVYTNLSKSELKSAYLRHHPRYKARVSQQGD